MPTSKPELLKAWDFSFYAGLQASDQTGVIRQIGLAGTVFPYQTSHKPEIITTEYVGKVNRGAHSLYGPFIRRISNGLN